MRELPPPSPRTSLWARFALIFFALVASLPAVVAIIAFDQIDWSLGWAVVTVLITLTALGLWYLAITGRNPFYQLELAGARRRAEFEDTPAPPILPVDVPVGQALIGFSVVTVGFAVLAIVPELLLWPITKSSKGLADLLHGIGFVVALYWYALFVMISKERGWFGIARRIVHGAVLAATFAFLIQHGADLRTGILWWATGGFVLGLFAEKWVRGL